MNQVAIDIKNNYFVLSGDISNLIDNRRCRFSLEKLNYESMTHVVKIPFEVDKKIDTLKDIQNLLKKFDSKVELCKSVQEEEEAYFREIENFEIFSEKARSIRNYNFDNNPELVADFRNFENTISKNLKRKLYRLQILSAYHMAFSQNACNFSVPGAGKTSIVYAAYSYLNSLPKDNSKFVDKILIIGPLSSFAPWENEYRECFGKEVASQRLSGDLSISKGEKEQHLYSRKPTELTLIFYMGVANLKREIIDFLSENRVMVVVDEAHHIKNTEGVWGKSIVEISEKAISRVILTGTPLPNGYEDLYNLFCFLYPFKYDDIMRIHLDQLKDMTKKELANSNTRVNEFVERIKPYFVRIRKQELNLPSIQESHIPVAMDEKQREIYDFIEEKYITFFKSNPSATLKDIKGQFNRAKLMRLRQAATNPSLLLKTLKDSLEHSRYGIDPNYEFVNAITESINDSEIFNMIISYETFNIPPKFLKIRKILEEKILGNREKAIVWTIFVDNAKGLQEHLSKHKIASELLIGEIPPEHREGVIEQFNNPENYDFNVVIANPFSVSESISLHKGCHNAIYMERDYNAAHFIQSKDRIHRVGLASDVVTNYYYTISDDSIDSVIDRKLQIKIRRMERIINEDIPLFSRIDDADETDIINELLKDYARRSSKI